MGPTNYLADPASSFFPYPRLKAFSARVILLNIKSYLIICSKPFNTFKTPSFCGPWGPALSARPSRSSHCSPLGSLTLPAAPACVLPPRALCPSSSLQHPLGLFLQFLPISAQMSFSLWVLPSSAALLKIATPACLPYSLSPHPALFFSLALIAIWQTVCFIFYLPRYNISSPRPGTLSLCSLLHPQHQEWCPAHGRCGGRSRFYRIWSLLHLREGELFRKNVQNFEYKN